MLWNVTLNAPRQGLFASLLIISFALQTFLLVLATTYQLKENRANQGQLMTSQLVADSLQEISPPNTVSLALIANRYSSNPSVASIRILSANNDVLATSGLQQTRTGEVFSRDALQNERKIGRIEITLIKPSIGEILRTEWIAIVLSFFLHVILWLAYRVIARPSRTEYLARIHNEMRLKNEIQALTEALEQEKSASASTAENETPKAKTLDTAQLLDDGKQVILDKQVIALNIQFYDPKQLLNSVSQSVATSHFNLCQIFLNKSIALCAQHYQIPTSTISIEEEFSAQGATICMSTEKPKAATCLLMISAVFQLLSEVLYKRYREEKRFVLQTRCGVSNAVDEMQLEAPQAAAKLCQTLSAKESAIHLDHTMLKNINECYQLITLPNPTNVLTRHAFMINGMNTPCAILAQKFRTDILKGKTPPQK
ncbi:hypothetical protein [Acinetobacter nectaris]|uniref:hypothetical protein n=1 Tax=Acinetobacter nectaris TaxID=1219382 RepID=UPI003898EB8C